MDYTHTSTYKVEPLAGKTTLRRPAASRAGLARVVERVLLAAGLDLALYPIVTLQYSSATLYQVSYHIR